MPLACRPTRCPRRGRDPPAGARPRRRRALLPIWTLLFLPLVTEWPLPRSGRWAYRSVEPDAEVTSGVRWIAALPVPGRYRPGNRMRCRSSRRGDCLVSDVTGRQRWVVLSRPRSRYLGKQGAAPCGHQGGNDVVWDHPGIALLPEVLDQRTSVATTDALRRRPRRRAGRCRQVPSGTSTDVRRHE